MVYINLKKEIDNPELLPVLYHVNSMDVFNLLQDIGSSKLIIDLRSKEQYAKSHIKTAVNISPPEPTTLGGDRIEEFNLTKYISSNVTAKHWNLIFQKVIVYSDKPFLYNIDEVEKTIGPTIVAGIKDQEIIKPLILSNWDKTILKHLLSKRKKTKVIIYQGGFNSFQQSYPFMCNGSPSNTSNIITSLLPLYPSEIIENFIYLGGQENAASRQQLENLKITHIINMANELDDVYPHVYKYYRADLDDRPRANIYAHLEPCIEFINQAKKVGGRVLVHCAMGISRSSTVVIAYLMKEDGMTFDDALQYCKSKRSIVNPNFGFVKQLKEYQVHLEKLKLEQQHCALKSHKKTLSLTQSTDKTDPLSNQSPSSPLISSNLPVQDTSPPIILSPPPPTPTPTLVTSTVSDSIFDFVDKQEEKMIHPPLIDSPSIQPIPQSSL